MKNIYFWANVVIENNLFKLYVVRVISNNKKIVATINDN